MDAGVTGILIAHLGAFGSGELIIYDRFWIYTFNLTKKCKVTENIKYALLCNIVTNFKNPRNTVHHQKVSQKIFFHVNLEMMNRFIILSE